MRYKVIYKQDSSGGGAPDGMTLGTFYTFAQAHASAQLWASRGSAYFADMWDGEQWRFYV